MSSVKALSMVSVAVLLGTVGCARDLSHYDRIRKELDKTVIDSVKANKKVRKREVVARELPGRVNDLMRVHVDVFGPKKAIPRVEPKFDVIVKEVAARDFFLGLMKDTVYNVVVDNSIQGNISLALRSVTIPQVMEALRDAYGYEYKLNDYGYFVYGRKLVSKVFNVNYINLSRKGITIMNAISASQLKEADVSGKSSTKNNDEGVTTLQQETPFWIALEWNLKAIIGLSDANNRVATIESESKSVVANANTNTVVVRAYPDELRLVEQYLKEVQNTLQRQVVIEAKVIEVELKDQFKSGIDWSVNFGRQLDARGNKAISIGQLANINFDKAINPQFTEAGFKGVFGSFAAGIHLLNTYGNIEVLSNPRITTLNNQKAVIKVGEETFYSVGLDNSTTSAGSNVNENNKIKLQVFFSGIALDVTPQIDGEDNIILHLHPTVCDVTNNNVKVTIKDVVTILPTAKSQIKESDTVVRARSGEVVVIGGLMETYSKTYKNGVPGLNQVPIVGEALKSRDQEAKKYEMVFLLRPIIVKSPEDWNQELKKISDRLQKLNKERFSYDFERKEGELKTSRINQKNKK